MTAKELRRIANANKPKMQEAVTKTHLESILEFMLKEAEKGMTFFFIPPFDSSLPFFLDTIDDLRALGYEVSRIQNSLGQVDDTCGLCISWDK